MDSNQQETTLALDDLRAVDGPSLEEGRRLARENPGLSGDELLALLRADQ